MSAVAETLALALGVSNMTLVGAVVTGRLVRPAHPVATPGQPAPAAQPEAELVEPASVVRVWHDGKFTDQP